MPVTTKLSEWLSCLPLICWFSFKTTKQQTANVTLELHFCCTSMSWRKRLLALYPGSKRVQNKYLLCSAQHWCFCVDISVDGLAATVHPAYPARSPRCLGSCYERFGVYVVSCSSHRWQRHQEVGGDSQAKCMSLYYLVEYFVVIVSHIKDILLEIWRKKKSQGKKFPWGNGEILFLKK